MYLVFEINFFFVCELNKNYNREMMKMPKSTEGKDGGGILKCGQLIFDMILMYILRRS